MQTKPTTATGAGLERGAMGTADIVFFVLAGVAPLGVVVAGISLAFALGNGPGVPGTFLIAGAVMSLFAIGYVQMSRRVTNVGGFYSYARIGLGARAGGAAAYVALIAYNAATIGVVGGLAYFSQQVASGFGIDVAWQWWALAAVVAVAVLAFFQVTLSAKVLGALLILEVLLLMCFNVAVLVQNGFHGFSLEVFSPDKVFSSGFGVTLMLAFGAFVGFEATALYGEEARNPRRSVPRATYIALALITVFYLVTTWAIVSAYGVDGVQPAAAEDPSVLVFAANAKYVGEIATAGMQILVITSLFAAFLAFHCNTARYGYALARDGFLPRGLARTHKKYGSPIAASWLQLALTAAVLVVTSLSGQNPYLGMAAGAYGLATIGIVSLQAVAAVSIVAFFLRNRRSESIWASIVAPALGAVGLIVGLVLMVDNYSLMAGGSVRALDYLPWLLPVAAVIGAIVAGRRLIATEPVVTDTAACDPALEEA